MPDTLLAGCNLPLKEAARRLGVSPHTLRGWAIRQHRIAYLHTGGRILFSPPDLAAFEARCRVEACEATGR